MKSKKKRVTITDIARLAGVSPTAVSFTLADRRDVSLSEAWSIICYELLSV